MGPIISYMYTNTRVAFIRLKTCGDSKLKLVRVVFYSGEVGPGVDARAHTARCGNNTETLCLHEKAANKTKRHARTQAAAHHNLQRDAPEQDDSVLHHGHHRRHGHVLLARGDEYDDYGDDGANGDNNVLGVACALLVNCAALLLPGSVDARNRGG